MVIYLSGRQTGYGIVQHFTDNGAMFAVAIVMGVVVYLVGLIDMNAFLTFGLQIVVGIAVYAGLSLMLKLEPAMYIIDFIKKK